MLTALTETISIDAPPEVVLNFVADPRNLPLWAPGFAQRVRQDGAHWLVESGEQSVRIDVRVARELGTVDFLAADAPSERPIGAYSRVIHNGDGSEYAFTRFLAPGRSREDLARERAVVVQELQAVSSHCAGKERPPARI